MCGVCVVCGVCVCGVCGVCGKGEKEVVNGFWDLSRKEV